MLDNETPTKQGGRKPSVSPLNGVPTPPGFEAHPERRHNGAWKKEETARWKYEQIIKKGDDELREILNDPKADTFSQVAAKSILASRELADSNPKMAMEVLSNFADRVYGKPKQEQELKIDAELSGININVKNYEK